MAVYPIKLLKDESGQPFVPLTSVEAIYGDKNLQYILNATQVSNGHFKIEYQGLTLDDIVNSIIAVRWPKITTVVKPSYLQLNSEAEKAIYAPDGTNYLDLEDSTDAVNFVAYDGSKWVLIGNASTGNGGHVITDGEGNTMEQQKILNFVGFNVENDNTNRATKVINPTPINNLNTTTSGQGPLDAYQGHVLNTLIESLKEEMLLAAHPIGSYYWSESNVDPSTLFGGTWVQIKDKFIIAAGDSHDAGTSYGSNTKNLSHTHTTGNHTLTVAEMPTHNHTESSAGAHSHDLRYDAENGNGVVISYAGSSYDVLSIESWAWKTAGWVSNLRTSKEGAHTHSINSTGSGQAHNHGATGSSLSSTFDITPACVAAYCWKRTA